MKQYLELMNHIQNEGVVKEDRTGTGTKSIFGYQMRFDLQAGFPLLSTKKVNLDSIIHELLWFIRGDTNIKYLVENNVGIWNDWPFQSWLKQTDQEKIYPMHSFEWKEKMKDFIERIKNDEVFALKYGELGPVYGHQWRNFEGVDQLRQVIQDIKANPDSRRLIVSAWNPKDIPFMVKSGLPPCHTLFQFYVSEGKLSCQLYQRSADVFLGVPYNIASYAILTLLIAHVTNLKPGDFVHSLGDAHLYSNHTDQAEKQLKRKPFSLPKLLINLDKKDIFEFNINDFELVDYKCHPHIPAPIAV